MIVEIKFNNNVASFQICFDFYDYLCIIEAAHEFTDSCWIYLSGATDGLSFLIQIEPKDSALLVEEATKSFFNYLLGIMNRKIKQVYL